MTRYMLNTNIISNLVRNPQGKAAKRIAKVGEDNICTADAEYGGIRPELEAAGKPTGNNDLLIAAHAYAAGVTIVTAHTAGFKRIRGLDVENWLA